MVQMLPRRTHYNCVFQTFLANYFAGRSEKRGDAKTAKQVVILGSFLLELLPIRGEYFYIMGISYFLGIFHKKLLSCI